jgi:hypothetical protein
LFVECHRRKGAQHVRPLVIHIYRLKITMKTLTAFIGGVAATAMLTACASAFALSHPNFQNAEQALQAAINHIQGAQQVNGPTFGGHAGRAIELIRQAQDEIAIADEYHRGVRY